MKRVNFFMVASVFVFLVFNVSAQSEFKVARGSTFTITQENQKMFVDRWVMEDDATIVISDGVASWEINASEARIGNNCRILGNGKTGANGSNSTKHGGNGSNCDKGGDGGAGESGTSGGNGSNIKITMGLVYINGLFIDVSGGNGGNGGDGANGGAGGRAACGQMCTGKDGGKGGDGGRGGNGGNGGNVIVDYWIVPSTTTTTTTPPTTPPGKPGNEDDQGENNKIISLKGFSGLQVKNTGGIAGNSGRAGIGGEGGPGKRCPPANTVRHRGGSRGANGNTFKAADGKKGVTTYTAIASPR